MAIDELNGYHGYDGAYEEQHEAQRQLVRHGAPKKPAQHFVCAAKLRVQLANRGVDVLHLLRLRVQLDSSLRAHNLQRRPRQPRQTRTAVVLGVTVVSSTNLALRARDAIESACACFASLRWSCDVTGLAADDAADDDAG